MVLKKQRTKKPHTFAQTLNKDLGFLFGFLLFVGFGFVYFFFVNSLNCCLSRSLRPYQEAHFSYPSISFLQNTASSEVSLSEIKEAD